MGRVATVAVGIGLAGCGGGAPVDDDGCLGGATVEVGTGQEAYEPVEDGDAVTIQHGPQGGWHIWTAIDVRGTGPNVSVLPGVDWPAGGTSLTYGVQATFVALVYDDATCEGTHSGEFGYIDTDSGPVKGLDLICSLAGETLVLSAEVEDLDHPGSTLTDSVEIVAELSPVDVDDCP